MGTVLRPPFFEATLTVTGEFCHCYFADAGPGSTVHGTYPQSLKDQAQPSTCTSEGEILRAKSPCMSLWNTFLGLRLGGKDSESSRSM